MVETMEESGKLFVSATLIGLGASLIILSFIISILDLFTVAIVGGALCGFGGFLYYLRTVSIKSQSRVKKAKVTRVVREVPKPKPKPEPEEIEEEKPKEPEIMCDTCQYYNVYHPSKKCRYLTDTDRLAMINAGLECVEYKIKLSLLDED